MKNKTWARASVVVLGFFITAGSAFAAPESTQKLIGFFDADDGTYAVETVLSIEACKALCEADRPTCRGTVIYQADVTKPDMQCRLNDGSGEEPAFETPVPETLDFDKALSDLNAYRILKGVPALTYDERLNRACDIHAHDLATADIISHTGTDGSSHGDRVQRQGYYFSIAGENVATGQMSWEAAFDSWKNSPPHNENMLRDDVSQFGLALVYEPTTSHMTYWAMIVAHPLENEYSADVN